MHHVVALYRLVAAGRSSDPRRILPPTRHTLLAHFGVLPHPSNDGLSMFSVVHKLQSAGRSCERIDPQPPKSPRVSRHVNSAGEMSEFVGGSVSFDAATRQSLQRDVRDVLHPYTVDDDCCKLRILVGNIRPWIFV